MFVMVARALLHGFLGVIGGPQTMLLLGSTGWLLGHCYMVARYIAKWVLDQIYAVPRLVKVVAGALLHGLLDFGGPSSLLCSC